MCKETVIDIDSAVSVELPGHGDEDVRIGTEVLLIRSTNASRRAERAWQESRPDAALTDVHFRSRLVTSPPEFTYEGSSRRSR